MSDAGSNAGSNQEQKGPSGGYDSTRIKPTAPGYTVKITFNSARKLPFADLSTLSADPYLTAELRTELVPRHKEDPVLGFRTRTLWHTVNPDWNEEWIVAGIPASGFKMKARLYDEDSTDRDDRLGNVHIKVGSLSESWAGINNEPYKIEKRAGSWRAYAVRGLAVCMGRAKTMSGNLFISVQVLERTPGTSGGRAYTVGQNYWYKHHSPMLGRMVGTHDPDQKPADVEKAEQNDGVPGAVPESSANENAGEKPNSEKNDDGNANDAPNGSAHQQQHHLHHRQRQHHETEAPDADTAKVDDTEDKVRKQEVTANSETLPPNRTPATPDFASRDKTTTAVLRQNLESPAKAIENKIPTLTKGDRKGSKSVKRYNFQANQFQFTGPVPEELYHRFVEFQPWIGKLFTRTGLRGVIMSAALHHQHTQVYNFNQATEYGEFNSPCREMTLKFLELCHFDQGGRIHTYVLTLDGLFRFTETGKEFGIDMLSKHTMHADRAIYIAYSGEFFVRRLRVAGVPSIEATQAKGNASANLDANAPKQHSQATHPPEALAHGPPHGPGPLDPAHYELVIDNDSGTYRPNAEMLPKLREFMEQNLPGLAVVTLDCQADQDLQQRMKKEQRARKKEEGGGIIYTQISRSSSISSTDEDRLRGVGAGAHYEQTTRLGEAVAPFTRGHSSIRKALGEKRVDAPNSAVDDGAQRDEEKKNAETAASSS